jgi:uncharacterized metal-binding protein YceD (DUF177 family)
MSEFSRVIAADAIGRTGALALTPSAEERAAVAARLGLEALEALSVAAELEPTAEGAMLRGTLHAELVQGCAATGLPIPQSLSAPFALRFVRDLGLPGEADAEVELDDDDCELMPFEPGGVDVGEAAVQTLALALDPYPRHADADRILAERGVLREDQAGPFAALAALKK